MKIKKNQNKTPPRTVKIFKAALKPLINSQKLTTTNCWKRILRLNNNQEIKNRSKRIKKWKFGNIPSVNKLQP